MFCTPPRRLVAPITGSRSRQFEAKTVPRRRARNRRYGVLGIMCYPAADRHDQNSVTSPESRRDDVVMDGQWFADWSPKDPDPDERIIAR